MPATGLEASAPPPPPPGPGGPLFQREDGTPVRFYLRPGPAKLALAPLILREGGRLCRVQEPRAILLVGPGEAAAEGFVSAAYITDCAARRERLPLEGYRLPGPRAARAPTEGRARFTEAEDRAVLRFVAARRTREGGPRVAGTAPWREMARAAAHPWQALRDRHLRNLRGREAAKAAEGSPKAPGPADGGGARRSQRGMEAPRRAEGGRAAEGRIFQLANKEFEDSEGDGENLGPAEDACLQHKELKTSEGAPTPPHPRTSKLEWVSRKDSPGPPAPTAPEVALAVEDMKHFMEVFGLNLEAVAQAFLKNSGEAAAVACYLGTGRRSDGHPLWSRQDDLDLLKGGEDLRSRLVARYGAENVDKREAFRRN